MGENIQRGEYLAQSKKIRSISVPAIGGLKRVYERGAKGGVFRPGLDPVDLHMSISALSVFNVANRHTFSLLFKSDFDAPGHKKKRRDNIAELVTRFVLR
jgi:hypothetical protein